MRRAVSLR